MSYSNPNAYYDAIDANPAPDDTPVAAPFGYRMCNGEVWCWQCVGDEETCNSRHVVPTLVMHRDDSDPSALCGFCGHVVTE